MAITATAFDQRPPVAPLNTLQNGDFVNILTSKTAHPSLDWLNFVGTPTARNRIRQWYKRSHRHETIQRGKDLLEQELGLVRFPLNSEAMTRVARPAFRARRICSRLLLA